MKGYRILTKRKAFKQIIANVRPLNHITLGSNRTFGGIEFRLGYGLEKNGMCVGSKEIREYRAG